MSDRPLKTITSHEDATKNWEWVDGALVPRLEGSIDTLEGRVDTVEGKIVPTGVLILFSAVEGSTPAGWLYCNGQAISRTTYSALFGVCGVAFGVGNGSTTFNIPDMRKKFPRGYDTTSGVGGTVNIASVGGADTHTLTLNEIPAHSGHGINAARSAAAGTGAYWSVQANGSQTEIYGSGGAHNNLPQYVALSYIIKT
jgi:microcystin-dependent protein